MRTYCRACGFHLSETAQQTGRCPRCGTAVPASAVTDLLGLSDPASSELPTQPGTTRVGKPPAQPLPSAAAAAKMHAGATSVSSADTKPVPQGARIGEGSEGVGRRPDQPPHQRRKRRRWRAAPSWQFALLSAVLLMLTGAALFALGHREQLSIVVSPFTSSSANASSGASSNPSAGGATTATTVSAHSTAMATALPSPSATPRPATLTVTPSAFTFSACLLANNAVVTVANTGGKRMTWSASANGTSYTISPSSGQLDAGTNQAVTIGNIVLSGSVTFTATSARDSPQHVSITCTV
jgi:hypothetical protein